MKLYGKAGVNPMAGCLPALALDPDSYALFQFFPSMFDLRQKSFLWTDDLSSYDSVLKLPFHIPFYGDHVSLFPILASIAIFFYMKMTTGDQGDEHSASKVRDAGYGENHLIALIWMFLRS